jgi:predicted KAP-like P-loop ATPase
MFSNVRRGGNWLLGLAVLRLSSIGSICKTSAGMARPMAYLLAFVVAFGVLASDASAHPDDLAATRAYLRAEQKLYSAINANLPISRKGLKGFVGQVAAGCPNVLAGFPQGEAQLPNLIGEELSALSAVAEQPDLHAELVFERSVSHLRWTNRALKRLIRLQSTEQEPKISAVSLCADYTTWAANGYRTLSGHTQSVLRRIEAQEKRDRVQGPKGNEGDKEAISRLLVPYERSSVRKLAEQVSSLEARLAEASLEIILGAAVEMDKDLGLPSTQNAAPA